MSLRRKADLFLRKLTHNSNTVSSSSFLVEQNSVSYSTGWKWWLTTAAGVGIICLAIFLDRFLLINAYNAPPGADPGNWLTFAWELGGKSIGLADWSYPPLLLIILRGFLELFNPMTSLKLLGLISWSIMGCAFFIILRVSFKNLPIYILLGTSLLFSLAGYHGEIFAWGGYPQLIGTSFLLIAVPATARWLKTGDLKWGFVGVLFTIGVIYTHHLMTSMIPILLIIVGIWQILFATNKFERKEILKKGLIYLCAVGILSIPAIPIYWEYWRLLGVFPTNANQFGPSSVLLMFQYVFQDSLGLWLVLLVSAIIISFTNPKNPMQGTIFAFILGPLIMVTIFWEVRFLPLILVGIGYGLISIYQITWNIPKSGLSILLWRGATIILLAVMLLSILPNSRNWFIRASEYYRVVDNGTYDGLTWLRDHSQPGDIVAASQWDPFSIGWWIQGYSERPCLYVSDMRWLFFQQEREYAAIANTLFSETTTPGQFIDIIQSQDIRWILVNNQHQPGSILSADHSGAISPVYSNSILTIYKVGRSR